MKLHEEFIQYLNDEVDNGSIYGWGGQGQKRGSAVTEAYIRQLERNTGGYSGGPSYADAAVALWKQRVKQGKGNTLSVFDCSGLGVYWLYNVKKLWKGDASANTMYGRCKKKLTINTVKKGDWVFRGSASKKTHIGYIVDDNGTVIEARGRNYGVVRSRLNEVGYWKYFARPDIFADEIEPPKSITPGKKVVEVIGGSVWVRDNDSTNGKQLFVARKTDVYNYISTADTGWYKIEYKPGEYGYISNKSNLTKLVNG